MRAAPWHWHWSPWWLGDEMTLQLATRTWGSGERRVLLLHGISSNASGWWRVADDLASAGWAITAPDLRGHGDSPAADSYRFDEYADDVLALGTGWDAVVGHSLGGAIAVTAHTADPGFAARMVLQDPALLVVETSRDDIMKWLLESFARPLTAGAMEEENPTWGPEDCAIKAEALRQCGAESVRQTVESNRPWNVLAETAEVTVPTSVIASDPEAGGLVAITIGEWMAATNPLIEFSVLSGAGHSAHREVLLYDDYFAALTRALEEGSGDEV